MGRRFGQHFLIRKSILDRIALAACGEHVPLVVEIGPGKGSLTQCLLERAATVVAIEVDTHLVHYLRRKFADALEAGRLRLIEGDVLKTDLAQWDSGVIAGNLPYYITSPILERVFALRQRAVFLVQAEVAARLAAESGSRDFGYLSVLTQIYTRPEILFPVSRAAFQPSPRVDSAVVLLEPRDAAVEFGLADTPGFLRFASACFRHKRKTLRNNLSPIYGKAVVETLEESGMRAEQLSVAQLVALYREIGASPDDRTVVK